ncbi:MAG: hypothetical protein R3C03_17510 [Pirellulaceae bacterium]
MTHKGVPLISGWHPLAKYLAALSLTVAAYYGYSLIVVPQIEGGQQKYQNTTVANRSSSSNAEETAEPRLASLESLPADAWERGICKRIEINEGTILFKDWVQNDDGTVEVFPFTLVINESSRRKQPTYPTPPPANPIVVRAAERAILVFDRPIRIGASKGEKLESCLLKGDVHLFRAARQPGDEDAFNIWTANVQLTPKRIVALEKVQFEFGSNSGIGRNLMIDLDHGPSGNLIRSNFETIEGFSRMELAFVERIRFVPANKASDQGKTEAAGAPEGKLNQAPIDVTCSGPFVFDFDQAMAEFSKDVVVTRIDGFRDQVLADSLKLLFEKQANRGPGGESDSTMKLSTLEIDGFPSKLNLPSQNASVVAESLVYDVTHNEIKARDSNKVTVEQSGQIFEARQVQYRIRPQGRLGPLIAEGAGRLYKPKSQSNPNGINLVWSSHLTIEPRADRHHVHIEGNVVADLPSETRLSGNVVELWLVEQMTQHASEPGRSRWDYQPVEVIVDGNVAFDAQQLHGTTELLKLIWEQTSSTALGSVNPLPLLEQKRQRTLRVPFQQNQPDVEQLRETGHDSTDQLAPLKRPAHDRDNKTSIHQIDVQGDRITIHMLNQKQSIAALDSKPSGDMSDSIREVEIDGHVVVEQVDWAGERQFLLTGETLNLKPQGDERFEAVVSGGGKIDSPQLKVNGQQIHLDQTANRVWIVGAGQLDIDAEQSKDQLPQLNGRESPAQVSVTWLAGMIFDGEKIYFEEDVRSVATQAGKDGTVSHVRSLSEGMSLQLSQGLDLSRLNDSGPRPDIQVVQLVLVNEIPMAKRAFKRSVDNPSDKPVVLERSVFNSLQQKVEKQLIVVPQVIANLETGDLKADGPGGLIRWNLESEGQGGNPSAWGSTNHPTTKRMNP